MEIQGTSKLLGDQVDKNNIVYSIDCWFMNVNFVFFLLLFFIWF